MLRVFLARNHGLLQQAPAFCRGNALGKLVKKPGDLFALFLNEIFLLLHVCWRWVQQDLGQRQLRGHHTLLEDMQVDNLWQPVFRHYMELLIRPVGEKAVSPLITSGQR